jgi:uracil-DNA glycosylase
MSTFLSTIVPKSWNEFFKGEQNKSYLTDLEDFLTTEYTTKNIYPKVDSVLSAYSHCRPTDVKCILLGQDPYHGAGQANGLSFSVSSQSKIPPSLKNIFKEYCDDLSEHEPMNGDLSNWAKNGVLLLNTVLTVEESRPGSHAKKGWEEFTLNSIKFILEHQPDAGFICLGIPALRLAEKVISELDIKHPILINAPHPSPLSVYRGFYGSKPFSRFNEERKKRGLEVVHWALPANGQKTLF